MNNEEKILALLEQLQQGQKDMQADISDLKTDVNDLRGDVSALKKDMVHHNHYVEPLLQSVKEGLDGWQERNRQIDRIEQKVDGHEDRVWALEQLKAQ